MDLDKVCFDRIKKIIEDFENRFLITTTDQPTEFPPTDPPTDASNESEMDESKKELNQGSQNTKNKGKTLRNMSPYNF